MKAIWKGSIGFGLVNIPVKLYSATEDSTLDLDMVDKRSLDHIKYKRVNERTGKEVAWEDIGKAFMVDDRYILLEDEDFEAAAPEKTKLIEVDHFVDAAEIDPIYFQNTYYLVPEKQGTKAYALLREALVKSKKAGVAQFVLRTAATLCILRPYEKVIALYTIRFKQEIRPLTGLTLPSSSTVKPNELKMALSLIKEYTTEFDISAYKNNYAAALMKIIKQKSKGKPSKSTPIKVVHKKESDDLMEQLKASLKKKKSA